MSSDPCQHRKRSKKDDCIICTECGIILAVDALVDTGGHLGEEGPDRQLLWPELKHTQHVPKATVSHAHRLLHELARNVCMSLGLSVALLEQTKAIVDLALERRLTNRGRAGRKAVAAAIYLLARGASSSDGGSGAPLSLRETAAIVGEAETDLCSTLDTLRPLVRERFHLAGPSHDPAIFLEKLSGAIVGPTECLGFERYALLGRAAGLCQFCNEMSLVEGRKSEAISLACLLIVWESFRVSERRGREWKTKLQTACHLAGLSVDTVANRYKEIKDALILEAGKMPFAANVGSLRRDNVSSFVDDILKHRGLFQQGRGSLPPAFSAARSKSEQRAAQIARALQRIQSPTESPTEMDFEDVIIERLLLHKVSASRIEAATGLAQLMSLEEEMMPPGHSDDSSGED